MRRTTTAFVVKVQDSYGCLWVDASINKDGALQSFFSQCEERAYAFWNHQDAEVFAELVRMLKPGLAVSVVELR